ncbi:pseudouridylate synthase RPUSD2-like [Condylostylus longicornis]|uniref:pseudouridylate synthase RPUSD2-like n=1 Tax=Condylostylus longicornis TaxID=2530218 RepID=UPI00244DAB7D|nr:pseudouridylate synthase RPUSD2-like [Condylostylus longicornis]
MLKFLRTKFQLIQEIQTFYPKLYCSKVFVKSLKDKMASVQHAQTQHGNSKFVDEENITVLRTTHSPISNIEELDFKEVELLNSAKYLNDDLVSNEGEPASEHIKKENADKSKCVWFFDSESYSSLSKSESNADKPLTNPEKRKTQENQSNSEFKKPKLETKDLKAKRPGFSEDRYNETSYYFENGLRKVYPYYFTFTTFTKGRWVGEKILDVFSREFRAHPAEEYERSINSGSLTVNYEKVSTNYILKHNDLLANIVHRHEVPVTNQLIEIIEMDCNMVAINKPASIPVHPCGRYRHNTVVFILAKEYNLKNLRTIHRLDRLTSGLLLFGRNPKKAREMEVQIRNREVKKEYVCRVEGNFPNGVIECKEPIEVVSYKIGVCKVSTKGKDCSTSFQKLNYDGKSSIVLCKPRTGRMHQIRVHLQFLGYPIINDPLYNHEVFGPKKGKGGDIGGKSDEQLVKDLIEIHNAENWLSAERDSSPFQVSDVNIENIISGNTKKGDKFDNNDEHCSNIFEHQNNTDAVTYNKITEIRSDAKGNKTTIATQTGHDPPDLQFDPKKLTKDEHCYECKINFADPKPKDLIMYLHAWKYEGPDWKYEAKLPDWAKIS